MAALDVVGGWNRDAGIVAQLVRETTKSKAANSRFWGTGWQSHQASCHHVPCLARSLDTLRRYPWRSCCDVQFNASRSNVVRVARRERRWLD